jgi:hypothetical protein
MRYYLQSLPLLFLSLFALASPASAQEDLAKKSQDAAKRGISCPENATNPQPFPSHCSEVYTHVGIPRSPATGAPVHLIGLLGVKNCQL